MNRREFMRALAVTTAALPAGSLLNAGMPDYFPAHLADYGVVGDGVTDCTEGLQRLIDKGGDIYLPPGYYKISSSLVMRHGSGRIIGTGKGKVTIGYWGVA